MLAEQCHAGHLHRSSVLISQAVEIVNELLLNGKLQAGEVVRRLDRGGNEHSELMERVALASLHAHMVTD